MSALVGTCHCGRVRITVPHKPDQVTHCNCSLCSKTGFQGIYYSSDELVIEGELDRYVRANSTPALYRSTALPPLRHRHALGAPDRPAA